MHVEKKVCVKILLYNSSIDLIDRLIHKLLILYPYYNKYYCIYLDISENQLHLLEININKENEAIEKTVTYDKSKLDKNLISAVQKRRDLYDLYDYRIPLKE